MRIIALSKIRSALCEKSTYMYIIYVYVCIIFIVLSLNRAAVAIRLSAKISYRLVRPDIPRFPCALVRAPPLPPTAA